MQEKIEIRPAAVEDVAALRRIGELTWPETYQFAGNDYIANGLRTWWSEEAIVRSLSTTNTYVAEIDGAPVAMGNIDLRTTPPTIWKLYVLPDCQGSGVGHHLMTRLLDGVPEEAGAVVLEYLDGNDQAAEFYRRHGFHELRRESGTTSGWPDTVWMIREDRR